MPPARKKGASNNNNTNNNSNSNKNNNINNSSSNKIASELKLGDLVLGKVKGFPAWPAKISRPEDWERVPDPKKYFVQFFGTQEIAFIAPADIQAFTNESKSKLLARCKGKTVKYFAQAVKEICEAFEKLQNCDLHCRVDNTVALGCEASIIADGKVNGTVVLKTEDSSWSSQVYDPASLLGDRGPADNKQIADMKDSVTQPDEMMRRERGLDSVSLVDVKALITDSSPPDIEGTLGDHKTDTIAYHERIESSRASSSSPYSSDPDVVRYSYNGAGKKDIHVSLEASGHHRLPSVGDKRLASRDKSKDLKTGPKKKIEGLIHHADQSFVKDQMLGKVSSGGNAKRSSSGANKFVSSVHGKTLKNLLKGQKQLNDSKDSPRKVVSGSGGHEDGEHNIRQKNGQVGQDQPQSAKKAKHMDRMGDASKGSAPNNGKDELESDMLSDEAVPPVAKRLRQTLEAVSCDDKRSIGIASLKHDIPKKRRAVQLYDDDDDEEPKTPVHGGSTSGCKVTSSTSVKKSYKNHESSNGGGQTLKNSSRDGAGNQKDNQPSTKFGSDVSLSDTLPQNLDNSKKTVSHGTGMEALDKRLVKDIKADLVSPTKSPQIFAALKKSAEQKPIRPFSKGNSIGSHSKALSISAKDPTSVSGHKSKQSLLVERARIPLKTGTRLTDSSASLDNQKDNDSVLDGRLEDAKDRSISLADPKTIDSAISMKNLIAAAQAKRRQAHTLNAPHANVEPVLAPSADLIGRSPSPSSTDPSFRGNWTPKDSHVLQSVGISASPSGHAQKLDLEEPDDKALSLVHQPAASALSGCTEAAVARDAFEGMIETLSRTKESIGRATRLAIDCAKYGIADEVVDLLTRKLENESSFHRRVDIFFLVDSITQCSHSQKGIAGASYLPSVQAALPRLLGAAAPAGPSARENRRQCLKVLRLWLERKILPESVLKRFMDDIGGSNDDTTSTGLAFRRPSRAERSVDDPIREMEGMLVDEYGSNATFNLPGFLSTHGFVDDEEDEDDILDTCHNQSNASPLNVSLNALAESEAGQVTPNDRRHHILEDVDGELEMEDVSGHPKDAVSSPYGMLEKEQGIQLYTEAEPSKDDLIEQSPLDGSPPLPLESPPPLPPLPTSPPPPPPPPLSPSPPPPPPPASTPVSYPLPPSLLPSGPPHAAICQPLLPLQPPVPPQVVMRPPSVIHPVQGGHPAQVAGNSLQQGPCFLPNGPSGSRLQEYGQNEMYPGPQAVPLNQQFQQLQPCQATFAQRAFSPVTLPPPPGHFTYNKPAVQQHMPHPRTHTPAPIPLPSHPYSTSNSEEQHMPHPRTHPPAPIPLPSHSYSASNSEGLRRFGDEQWRPALAEYKSDHHHNTWITEGRTQSCPTAKFIGEAYFRPPERPLTDNMTYHASAPNPVLAGPSTSGHGVNQMMPSRPELSSLSCWRPS